MTGCGAVAIDLASQLKMRVAQTTTHLNSAAFNHRSVQLLLRSCRVFGSFKRHEAESLQKHMQHNNCIHIAQSRFCFRFQFQLVPAQSTYSRWKRAWLLVSVTLWCVRVPKVHSSLPLLPLHALILPALLYKCALTHPCFMDYVLLLPLACFSDPIILFCHLVLRRTLSRLRSIANRPWPLTLLSFLLFFTLSLRVYIQSKLVIMTSLSASLKGRNRRCH